MKTALFFKKIRPTGEKQFFTILSFIIIFCFKANASNYYWIGGTGNWNDLTHWATTSGGTVLYTQIPTALDDVYFDANSFSAAGQTVNFNPLTILVHSINWTGVTHNPTLTAPASNLLKIYGSLTFVAGMNMSFLGKVDFESTTAGQTITSAGKIFNNDINFNGISGTWTLQDELTVSGTIILNAGTLTTNNNRVNAEHFLSKPIITTRTLNMGSSVFNVGDWYVDNAPMIINCGTSVVNIPSGEFRGGDYTYYDLNFTSSAAAAAGYIIGYNNFHDVVFSSKGYISQGDNFHNVIFYGDGLTEGDNVYNDLTFTAGHSYSLWSYSPTIGSTTTVNGTFHANGTCGALIDIHSKVPGAQATISHPAGAVNVSYLVLKDINATGGATFTASNSSNLGNNTGWNFTAVGPQDLYWIGNGGNWSDGNHWSHTSGGAPSGCSPTPSDNVFFDANSFSSAGQTVLMDPLIAYCRNMVWTAVSNNPTLGGPASNFLKIYGSLSFAAGMSMSFSGKVNFESIIAGQTITSAGKVFNNDINFNGIGGTWTLQDDLVTYGILMLNAGTLTTNNKTVNAGTLQSTSAITRTLNMGSSVFNVGYWYIDNAPMIINCGTSVVNMPAGEFRGGDYTYYDLNFTSSAAAAAGYIIGYNNFHDVVFSSKGYISQGDNFHNVIFYGDGLTEGDNVFNDLTFTAGHSYSLWSYSPTIGSTTTVNGTFHANGTCGALIDIHSKVPGAQATISHPAGAVNVSYLVLKDINATGGATFTASNSSDLGNNTGWNFTAAGPQDLYWIGNGGNWSDGNHWSHTSGGAPSGCSPTPSDNVFFDANSFSSAGQTVLMDPLIVYCRNMVWTGVTNSPVLNGNASTLLKIYGSLIFSPNMSISFSGSVNFEATSLGQTITMAGKAFHYDAVFNGIGGGWTFEDAFSVQGTLELNNGTLTTNNKTVNAGVFQSVSGTTRTLNLGASVFNITSSNNLPWFVDLDFPNLMTINSGTSVINIPTGQFCGGATHTYYDLNFTNTTGPPAFIIGSYGVNQFHNVIFATPKGYISHPSIFNSLTFKGDGEIASDNICNNLNYTAGHTYIMWKNTTQTVIDHWRIQGTCTSYIVLETNQPGFFASYTKTIGEVPGYNIHIKDIHCSGGANFIAYNSVDLGGNTGWNFSMLPPLANPNTIIGPTVVCSGSATTVVYHIPPVTGAISYQWTVPAGATIVSGQGDTSIVVNFGTATSGDIVVQSFNGCNVGTISSALTIEIITQLDPSVFIVADTLGPVCAGAAITFTATALNTGGNSLIYDFKINGVSAQSSNSNIFITTALSNNDEVSCVVTTTATSCFAAATAVSDTLTITVNTDPAPDPHISITANPSGQLCTGMPVTFTATVTGAGSSSINYNFKVNGISTQSSSSNTFTIAALSNNDAITCEIVLSATTCFASTTTVSNSITVNVNTDPAPNPHVSMIATPVGPLCAAMPITFTATTTGAGNNNIEYDFKINGNSVQHGSSNIFTTSTLMTNDAVTCYISVTGSCFSSTSATSNVIVLDGGDCDDCILHIPNAITPNGDGINDRWIISNQYCFRQVDVFIYNRYGSQVYQKNNYKDEWDGRYKNQTLPDGTYYYLIKAIKRDGKQQAFKGNITILR